MIKHISQLVLLLFATILLSTACGRNDQFDEIPHLEWVDHEIEDQEGNRREVILTTYFTDGDGNIGRDTVMEPCQEESYDLLIWYFEKVEGSYVQILPPDSCQPFHNVFPDITPEGQNKTLEGEISATFSYFAYPQNPDVDSVKFDLQLQDRAGNKSEIISSGAIFIPPL